MAGGPCPQPRTFHFEIGLGGEVLVVVLCFRGQISCLAKLQILRSGSGELGRTQLDSVLRVYGGLESYLGHWRCDLASTRPPLSSPE